MEHSNNPIPTFRGQSSRSPNQQAMTLARVDSDHLDRYTLTRRLSGNSLLDDASKKTDFPMERPRRRGASTSICLPEPGGPWVTVPQRDGQTLKKSNHTAVTQDIVVEDGVTESLPLPKLSSPASGKTRASASLMTTLPLSSHGASSLLPPSCSHSSVPSRKLDQVRQKACNEALYEKLLQYHGIDREHHPVKRRLSISGPPASQQILCMSPHRRPRRKSTSTYQVSNKSAVPLDSTNSTLRTSPVLGPIDLPSPVSPQALCIAAIADFDETQATLMDAWSPCCRAKDCIPPIQYLWMDLSNFSYAAHLFTAFTTGSSTHDEELFLSTPDHHNWLQPDARASYMTWRTPEQKKIHRRLGIAYDEDWATWADDDARERYPLSGKQLMTLARVCFEASDMLWPLINALRELSLWQRRLLRAKTAERWGLYLGLKREVHRCIDECVLIAQCPLVSWLRNAREDVCAALGLDADKVPKGEEKDDETVRGALLEGEDVRDQEDEKNDEVVFQEKGVPRRLRIRIATSKARYYFFCLLSPRCSFDKHEELATNLTLFLQQMEEENSGNEELRTKLIELRQRVMRRLAKTEKVHHVKIHLLDSTTREMTQPVLAKRIISGIKAGWEKLLGRYFWDDLDELFLRWDEARERRKYMIIKGCTLVEAASEDDSPRV